MCINDRFVGLHHLICKNNLMPNDSLKFRRSTSLLKQTDNIKFWIYYANIFQLIFDNIVRDKPNKMKGQISMDNINKCMKCHSFKHKLRKKDFLIYPNIETDQQYNIVSYKTRTCDSINSILHFL